VDEAKLEAARQIKSQYDTSMRRIMAQQGLQTEFELWTSFALSKPAMCTDYKRQEDLGFEYDTLKQRFRDVCYQAAGGSNADKIDPFVVAMYKVTEEDVQRENNGPLEDPSPGGDYKSMPLISFPWIFHWVMIRLAMGEQYSPDKMMMAAARREATRAATDSMKGSCAPNNTENTDASKSAILNGSTDGDEKKNLVTELPNGSLIARGQLLNLFDLDDHGAAEESADKVEDVHSAVTKFVKEWELETGEQPDVAHGKAAEGSSGGDEGHVVLLPAMESAVDRLAKLMDFDEDEE
jgi:hypothetical protein